MSLYKQLWLSIAFLMALGFTGSFIVSSLSARAYLEEELYRKNIDNASSLALSLSTQASDSMMIEHLITAQFDAGHYQFIIFIDVNGEKFISQSDTLSLYEAPAWLIRLFPINISPGVAQVSNGWQQLGTITLSSDTRFAYNQLWSATKLLFIYFFSMAILSCVLGSILLRIISRPLGKAVAHAHAISERRFITTKEPKTREFKALIKSMNKLSKHVKEMLEDESSKLEEWRQRVQVDKVTNLLNREPILSRLKAFTKEESHSGGGILLIRIADLFSLNQFNGRQTMDDLLGHLGSTLTSACKQKTDGRGVAGRLNGSDFIVLLPELTDRVAERTREIFDHVNLAFRECSLPEIQLYAGSTDYEVNEDVGAILRRIDNALDSASKSGSSPYIHVDATAPSVVKLHVDNWKEFLESALAANRFKLGRFPVTSQHDKLMHFEAPARLIQKDGSLLNAGQFMPHINRLNLGTKLDFTVTKLALEDIQQNNTPIGINLSSSLLKAPIEMEKIASLIQSSGSNAKHLWLEIPEFGVFQNIDGFREFCNLIKPFDCNIGIEHLGHEVMHIGKLHDLGLDYVKVDGSIIHDIDKTTSNQVFLRGLRTIVQSIGLTVIAESVETQEEWICLKELGIDGGTGKYFSS